MSSARRLLLQVAIIAIIHATIELQTFRPWRTDRRPSLMGAQIPFRGLIPTRRKLQHKIAFYHNLLRTKVHPSASNMLRMKWHRGAASAAQKWADKCMARTHDNTTGRHIPRYGACGQNIFIATQQVPWMFAIKTWFLEKDNFTYGGKKNDLGVVGHYTQMVWASTHRVGCGLAKCYMQSGNATRQRAYYNYVCNYCPIGNRPEKLSRPYKVGKPCTRCRRSCHAKKLCTNACPSADYWSNCKELHRAWPKWLCSTPTSKGRERMLNCQATCTCRTKIHD